VIQHTSIVVPVNVKPLFSLRTSVVGPAAVNWGAMGARFDMSMKINVQKGARAKINNL
jgi:hypothetical protein